MGKVFTRYPARTLAAVPDAGGRRGGPDPRRHHVVRRWWSRRSRILLDLAGLLSSGSVGVGGAVVAPMAGPEQAADESGAATPAFKPG